MLQTLVCAATVVACNVEALASPPLSVVDPRTLYPTVQRHGDTKPSSVFGSSNKPKPTNAWWENLVLAPPGSQESNVFQMPYIIVANTTKLQAMVPQLSGITPMQTLNQSQAISIGAVETMAGPTVDAWAHLGVTLDWQGESQGMGMKVPLVQGSPYVTAEFSRVTPRITSALSLNGTSIYVDGIESPCDGSLVLSGSMFSFTFPESRQTWVLFAPQNSEWLCLSAPFSMTAISMGASLQSVVRIALSSDSVAYTALLKQHAGRYPVGASVDFRVEGDIGSVSWEWSTSSLTGWPDAPLLQLAWPVHMPLLSTSIRELAATNPATPFRDSRGRATAVVGDVWHLTYELFPDVGLKAPRPIDESMRSNILDALRGSAGSWSQTMPPDHEFDLPLKYQLGAGDTYFSGKMIARLARIVAIADELGESNMPYFTSMVDRLIQRLETWLGGASKSLNPFLYDASWGGMVACGCIFDDCGGNCTPYCNNSITPPEACPAMKSTGVNFGNGYYNDHHYHYGYFVYSSAVAAKFRPAWERQNRQQILALVRDYANPSDEDPSFPVARHKDWFLGFSWAGGITVPFVNGRNEESTSEAINAYYAIYAYGSAVDAPFSKQLKDLGRILTAMEVHGADTYWHVRNQSDIYGLDFPFDFHTVGMLWSNMVTHQTYFGMQSYFVEGIHLMPMTPAMESYLKQDWVLAQFPSYKAACDSDPHCSKSGFSWQVCLEQAVIDTAQALACLESLPSDSFSTANPGSNGNSLTNSLHWIATRPTSQLSAPRQPTILIF